MHITVITGHFNYIDRDVSIAFSVFMSLGNYLTDKVHNQCNYRNGNYHYRHGNYSNLG